MDTEIVQQDLPEDYNGIESSLIIEEAKENGWVVVFPLENQLQIDIDHSTQYAVHCKALERYHRFSETWDIDTKQSKSGRSGHLHITITLPKPVTPLERITLQALLGSDPTREFLSYMRLKVGDPHPTLFVEKGPEEIE